MKTFYVTLTSEQLAPYLPSVIDHWFFLDRNPTTGLLTGYFPYPRTIDNGSFLVAYVSGAGDSNANGYYYYRDNHYFYQDNPSNGYSINLSASNWAIVDALNEIQYTTPYTDFYSLQNTWSALSGAAPSPVVALTAIEPTYTSYVCGGEFFPWGYQVIDQIQYIPINEPKGLKGDTTIVFIASAIDTTYHDVLKIVYSPGNGDETITINRPILPKTTNQNFSNFLIDNQYDSPIYTNVSFVYRASSVPVTYYPSVTALYGDMTRLFYNFMVTIHPNSIYDIDGVHLMGLNQSSSLSGTVVSLLSIESKDSIVGNMITPSK